MTAIMSSVLTTLVTNNINTVNRVKSDTDGEIVKLQQGCLFMLVKLKAMIIGHLDNADK